MPALLISLAAFVVWSVIGFALVAAVRAELDLRVVLTAPALGSAATVLPLFFLSNLGVSMSDGAPATVAVLLAGAAVVLWRRRPRLPVAALPPLCVALLSLVLVGWPMFEFGFDWIANASADMTNYVLSATLLLHHGLLAPLDVVGLVHDRDYASSLQILHAIGARPGADIALSALSGVSGRPPYQLFMPLIVAANGCTVSAVGALAMQATRRSWGATTATVLIALSPLATFGITQQLLPQVWGLGLAAALCALLMRPELHEGRGATFSDIVLIGVLAAALVAVYVELATTILAAYALYVAIRALHRGIRLRAVARLWVSAVVIVAVALNSYLFRELIFASSQTSSGTSSANHGGIFDFTLVPAVLPAIAGLVGLAASYGTPHLSQFIAGSIVLLAGVLVAAVLWMWRGMAAATVLVSDLAIGVYLGTNGNAFGLFKLYMYVQPFLAAAVAVWLVLLVDRFGRTVGAVAIVLVALFAALMARTQRTYVSASRNPAELTHASASNLLPAFRRTVAMTRVPLLAATTNLALAGMEAAEVGDRPLHFFGRDNFDYLLRLNLRLEGTSLSREVREYRRRSPWKPRTFDLLSETVPRRNTFVENRRASALLESGKCVVLMASGTQEALNRRVLPEGSPALAKVPCGTRASLLVFTTSRLGQSFYGFQTRRLVSFYPLEPDFFFPQHTFMGFGRWALFRVLGPSRPVRLELDLTTSLIHDGVNALPPAAAVGGSRVALPLTGRGSARVFSAPLRPQIIAGQPYIVVDMGKNGTRPSVPRPGPQGLYGRSIKLDPRYLTSYVRDISLVSSAQYARLKAPRALTHFPADLGNPDLEYSGIYEDGWLGDDAYAFLAGGPAGYLVIRADVPRAVKQRLTVTVDGHVVASVPVKPGPLDLRVPIPASSARRRLELRWAKVYPLAAPDLRPTTALLSYLGVSAG